MSINNYILNLLNIEDNNIYILPDKIETKIIKGKHYKIFECLLTYTPEYCPCCGCVNFSHNDIIKWGFRKNCKIKISKISIFLLMLILHKQRFLCKQCNNTFMQKHILLKITRIFQTIRNYRLILTYECYQSTLTQLKENISIKFKAL